MTDPAGAGILMLTWLGYIDGIHVTIYSSTMDPMGYANFMGCSENSFRDKISALI